MGFPDIESRNRALESSAASVKWRVRFLLHTFPRFINEKDDIEQFAWMMLIKAANIFRPGGACWCTYADSYLKHLVAQWFKYKGLKSQTEWESLDEMTTGRHDRDMPQFQVADLSQSRAFNCIEFGVSAERRKRQQRAAMRKARGLSVEKTRALEERFLLAA